MELSKILDSAKRLKPSKFISWAEDMKLNPVIENRDDIFNVNLDDVRIDVLGNKIFYSNGQFVHPEE